MGHFDIPFVDKNNERRMLAQRVDRMTQMLGRRIFTDSEDGGDFLFREGQNTIANINEGEWIPFGKDDYWGYREQYCWFKQTVTVPERFAGKEVVYEISVFPDDGWRSRAQQFIVFVNGEIVQGIDPWHTFIFLSHNAKGGETFDIALNAYCDDMEFIGKGQLRSALKVFDREVSDLCYDLEVPLDVAHQYDHDALERVDIVKALNETVNLLEMCTPDEAVFKQSVRAASAYIHKELYGKSMDVLTSAIGHTHIDVAWRWRLRQSRDKAGRSFATVINLMEEYPDYKFMSPQAQLYDFVKQDYPDLYEKIKQKVKEGRWEAEGSMWVESDTNVISGESLVRQFLVGKRFFKQEFGVDNKIMWLPDVFGYSAALPQIMKKAGIDYFMTTKISWSEFDKHPYDTFMWKGIDGTEILSHFIPSTSCKNEGHQTTYNANLRPDNVLGGWRRYSNKDLNRNVLCCYGHGDGGGGPTRGMIENGLRMAEGVPGCPKMQFEFSRSYFDRLAKEVKGSKRLPKWAGELYLEYHRGTLTAQARNKRYNRKSELLYQDAECLNETAGILCGTEYPAEKLLDGWKIILLNQFHDIIPGSSIKPVYEDSKAQYETIGADGRAMVQNALAALSAKVKTDAPALVVFNTLGSVRSDVVITDLPAGFNAVVREDGTVLPCQKTFDGKFCFLAENVPAKGFKAFRLANTDAVADVDYTVSEKGAENAFYKLSFNGDMNIDSLYHKESGRFAAPENEVLNRLIAYEDRSHVYEAWDIKCYYDEKSWDINDVQSVELLEQGTVRSVLKVTRRFNLSTICQYFIFYPHTARIDVAYDVDWKEKNIALKADYPVDVNTVKATYDIQFGNIERTTHNNTTWDFAQFEACGHRWADLSDNGFGLSVLNDCKYGWSIKEGHIKPTLLRSATEPNPDQDRERHLFTYAIYPHSGAVNTSDVVAEGGSLNVPLYCNRVEAQPAGEFAAFSLIGADKDNIIIETVKKAEDSNALIVRMYETWNKATPCTLTLGVNAAKVCECNLLEEDEGEIALNGNQLALNFKPFELKTLKIQLA